MKGINGMQMQVHPKFHEVLKDIIDDRVKIGKERSGDLSFKRLSLTIYKLLRTDKRTYDLIVNAEINKNEQ